MADRPRRAAQRGAACAMVLALMAAQVGEVRAASEWYSSMFVANRPGSVVVTGEWRMAS